MFFPNRILIFMVIKLILIDVSLTSMTKFQIELKTPGNTSETSMNPHKSVHVKYEMANSRTRWTIVGFEPILPMHFKSIEQLSIVLCYSSISEKIWYDDQTHCYARSTGMLIYHWNPNSASMPFYLPENYGFLLNRSISIVFTVTYRKENVLQKEQTSILLTILNKTVKYPLETITAGDSNKVIRHVSNRFSCRSIDNPRLLFALKKTSQDERSIWWRIHIVRVRQFGRKLAETVFQTSNQNQTSRQQIEFVSTDLFLIKGDYLLIECENVSDANCSFLVYYMYKSSSRNTNHLCSNDDYPDLFKMIPRFDSSNNGKSSHFLADADGWTVFLLILLLLFVIWISIIIGCVIMRRVRGLVNFRTIPSSLSPSERNKFLANALRSTYFGYSQRGGDADHIMQNDVEQGGMMF